MEINEYILKMQNVQKSFLFYLGDDYIEENFLNLLNLITEFKFLNDENTFRALLHLIDTISSNHFRNKDFIAKIEKLLFFLKDFFPNYLTNSEIFNIFKENKRILYFLFVNQIIYADYYIANVIMKNKKKKYPNYFLNEIKPFILEKTFNEIETENKNENVDIDSKIYEQNRIIGENESEICKIIREDDIENFKKYMSQNRINMQEVIKPSIFETNYLLTSKTPTLIEYAAYNGSMQIFKYLFKNGGNTRPFIWLYAIHSDKPEILYFLSKNKVEFEDKTHNMYIFESIRCHHNEVANYFIKNYNKNEYYDFVYIISLMCYNFVFFPENLFNRKVFFHLCQNDHFFIVQEILKNKNFYVDYLIKDNEIGFESVTTPLNAAISNDNANIVKILLENQEINLNTKSIRCKWAQYEETQNALYLSICNNNEKIIELLLSKNDIDLNMVLNSKVYKPNDSYQIVEHFPLIEAIQNRNYSIINLLVSHPKININCQEKIHNFSNSENYSENCKLVSPLDLAIYLSDTEIARILASNINLNPNLVSANISLNSEYRETPLYFATRLKAIEIVNILIMNPKIDVNKIAYIKIQDKEKKETALHCAVLSENIAITKILLSNPSIDLNIKSWVKFEMKYEVTESTALSMAVLKEQEEIVKVLLNNVNVDVNATYTIDSGIVYEEKSPLFLAVEKQNINIIKLLLSNENINVNYVSLYKTKNNSKINKTSILNKAIENNNVNIIKLLLNSPLIDVNLKSMSHKSEEKLIEDEEITPIDQAISIGNIEVIKLLLIKSDIDMKLKSKRSSFSPANFFIEEKTPIQKAITLKNIDIICLIFDKLSVVDDSTLDFNELINMTDNETIKAIIYNGINKLRFK